MKKVPMRMCASCRERFDKRSLLRIVKTPEGEVQFDPTTRQNGRGVYICDNAKCIEKIKNPKLTSNAFDIRVDQEALDKIYEDINNYINGKK